MGDSSTTILKQHKDNHHSPFDISLPSSERLHLLTVDLCPPQWYREKWNGVMVSSCQVIPDAAQEKEFFPFSHVGLLPEETVLHEMLQQGNDSKATWFHSPETTNAIKLSKEAETQKIMLTAKSLQLRRKQTPRISVLMIDKKP
ncbi:hypothetical protein TURU_151349 [Turdus rufiventris]|nr:hypothetical protein TURU_151349 [Turdus rufiventris]